MRLSRRILFAVAGPLATLFLTPSAQAIVLANRVFMSTNGNDSNVCSNPLTPCLTVTGSLAQVAAGGEVIAEVTGGYGFINITKSVQIIGAPGVLMYSGATVTVSAPGATVVLRGLTIDGTGTTTGSGINVVAVAVLHVESCVITGFAGTGSNGNGIYFTSDGLLSVKDTIIRGNGYVGIWVNPASGPALASVDHCRLEENGWGLISNSLTGIAKVTIRDSVSSGNSYSGLLAENGAELNAEGCLVANNYYGLQCTYSTFRASNCTVTDNVYGVVASGSTLSRSNNTVEGNGTDGSFTGTYSAK
jgi:hypothetical protein